MNEKEFGLSTRQSQADLTGSCLCGGVSYRIEGEVRGVINCFCTQCQKTSGHHVAATRVERNSLTMLSDQSLSWYASTPGHQRGFCAHCGGNVFWRKLGEDHVSVMAGTLDKPTGLRTIENIFVDDASDYFELPAIAPGSSGRT